MKLLKSFCALAVTLSLSGLAFAEGQPTAATTEQPAVAEPAPADHVAHKEAKKAKKTKKSKKAEKTETTTETAAPTTNQ